MSVAFHFEPIPRVPSRCLTTGPTESYRVLRIVWLTLRQTTLCEGHDETDFLSEPSTR